MAPYPSSSPPASFSPTEISLLRMMTSPIEAEAFVAFRKFRQIAGLSGFHVLADKVEAGPVPRPASQPRRKPAASTVAQWARGTGVASWMNMAPEERRGWLSLISTADWADHWARGFARDWIVRGMANSSGRPTRGQLDKIDSLIERAAREAGQ